MGFRHVTKTFPRSPFTHTALVHGTSFDTHWAVGITRTFLHERNWWPSFKHVILYYLGQCQWLLPVNSHQFISPMRLVPRIAETGLHFSPGHSHFGYQIFWEVVGLERGPFSLVSTTEELLGRNSSGSGLDSPEHGRGNPTRWLHDTLYSQKLALTSFGRYSSIAD
jgi:hypothetical protein